jgi:MbtH protein
MSNDDQVPASYHVVINDEGQYSIWPVERTVPAGWHAQDFVGPAQSCLNHINVIWTDMRPLSLRNS